MPNTIMHAIYATGLIVRQVGERSLLSTDQGAARSIKVLAVGDLLRGQSARQAERIAAASIASMSTAWAACWDD